MIFYSLIIATLGESMSDLLRCLDSIKRNESFNGEIIIVFQGDAERGESMRSELFTKGHKFVFVTTHLKGLSKARNLGISKSSIQSTCYLFPDDDCYYPVGFFAKLDAQIRSTPRNQFLILGSVYDPELKSRLSESTGQVQLTSRVHGRCPVA